MTLYRSELGWSSCWEFRLWRRLETVMSEVSTVECEEDEWSVPQAGGEKDVGMRWCCARARGNALGVPDALSRERIQAYRVSVTRDISHLNAPGTITLRWLAILVVRMCYARHRETGLNHWSGDNRLEVCGNSLVVDSRACTLRPEQENMRTPVFSFSGWDGAYYEIYAPIIDGTIWRMT